MPESLKEFGDRRAGEFRTAAIDMRQMALHCDRIMLLFDDRAENCPGCGATTFLFFAQRIARQKLAGVSERLRNLADECERRARDPGFIGEPTPTLSPKAKMAELDGQPDAG